MKKGILLLVVATLLWSGNYIAGRVLAPAMPAYFLNGVRWVISAFILWLILRLQGKSIPLKREWKILSILGFVGMFAFSTLTYLGLKSIPAAQAGMISGMIPVIILLFSVLFLHDRPPLIAWLGIVLSVIGVIVLFGAGSGSSFTFSLGDLELVIAAVAWGLYTVLGKRRSHHIDPLTMTAGAAIYGAIPSAIAGILSYSPTAIHMTPVAWLSLLYVSTAASVVAYFVWTSGVHVVGASRSAPFMNLLPIWTVILGISLLGEHLSIHEMIGGTIILAGAVLANLRGYQ
ncbi:DMT family transporter [Sulfoacidibacillus thermotolerans]|uniref:EamA domain-containing protein n=1 Tax=Sulfoacidibacillus thermotolerans TaxID=1765684 RepID=A0A2U3D8R7_SULT2|nr:DMT family transporter [Sulfoacidibacillus thermotolerans]PWI57672.1 hypothetical protein BM613_07745 [Sulfoacidibacillus thermotolerans]